MLARFIAAQDAGRTAGLERQMEDTASAAATSTWASDQVVAHVARDALVM